MNTLSSLIILLVAAVAVSANQDEDWENFKTLHNYTYHSKRLDSLKQANFHNFQAKMKGLKNWSHNVDLNSPLAAEDPNHPYEYKGFIPDNSAQSIPSHEYTKRSAAPYSFDWRNKGMKLAATSQGKCGSCWAFATASAIEAQVFIHTGKNVQLSPQFLVDCLTNSRGCQGENTGRAARFAATSEGSMILEQDMKYKMAQRNCIKPNTDNLYPTSTYKRIDNTEAALKSAVANDGPVIVVFHASQDTFYGFEGSGVYNGYDSRGQSCPNKPNHAVVLVGYKGNDYWILKNSWGTTWGDQGYFKMKMKHNICGLFTESYVPIMTSKEANEIINKSARMATSTPGAEPQGLTTKENNANGPTQPGGDATQAPDNSSYQNLEYASSCYGKNGVFRKSCSTIIQCTSNGYTCNTRTYQCNPGNRIELDMQNNIICRYDRNC